MASPNTSTPPPNGDTPTSFDLKILLPSDEAGNLSFPAIATSTTVLELKQKIKESLASHPPVERLRVIHHGRVSKDEESLQLIFSRVPPHSDNSRVLHVVVGEPRNAAPPQPQPQPTPTRSSAVPPASGLNTDRQVRAQLASVRGSIYNDLSRQGSRSGTPQPDASGRRTPSHAEVVNEMLNQHFAAHGHLHNAPGAPQPQPAQVSNAAASPDLSAAFARLRQTEQQMRSGSPQNGTNTPQTQASAPSQPQVGAPQIPRPAGPTVTHSGTSVTQSGLLPDGSRWSSSFQSHPVFRPGVPSPGVPGIYTPFGVHTPTATPQPRSMLDGLTTTPRSTSPLRQIQQLPIGSPQRTMHIEATIARLQGQLAQLQRVCTAVGAHIATRSHPISLRGDPSLNREARMVWQQTSELDHALRVFREDMGAAILFLTEISENQQFQQIQDRMRSIAGAVSEFQRILQDDLALHNQRATSQNTQQSPIPLAQGATIPPTSAQPMAYIVTDPSGNAHGLLIGPNGRQLTDVLPTHVLRGLLMSGLPVSEITQTFDRLVRNVYQQTTNDLRSRGVLGSHATTPAPYYYPPGSPNPYFNARGGQAHAAANANNPFAQAPAGEQAAQQPLQQQQARQPDEMRDLLAPVIRNLWLLIRIGGLLYFIFGGRKIVWRPFIIMGLGFFVYAVQRGMLGDRFDFMRRWLNRIVGNDAQPVAADGEEAAARPAAARDGAAPLAAPQPAAAAEGPARTALANAARHTPPNPADAARRLVAQRHANHATWLETQWHAVERTLGLFFASLWPGVGEQAVRLQEEREERARREAEEEEEERRRVAEAAEEEEAAKTAEQEKQAADGDGTQQAPAEDIVKPSVAVGGSSNNGPSASGVQIEGSDRLTVRNLTGNDA